MLRNKLDESNTINAIKEGDWGSVESVTISGYTHCAMMATAGSKVWKL